MRRLFYDTSCPACKRIVKRIGDVKNKKMFMVSSLDGKKAKLVFQGNYAFMRKKKSKMIILDGKRVWMKGNAMLRVYWLMGGAWKILGIFSFIPSFMLAPFVAIWVKILNLKAKVS
ncbi:MAG: hypothetical protein S4CHLAM20_03190 [Chlamydiia bacterium]|nr:hypothetical protein [Chlamydiia bacterium]